MGIDPVCGCPWMWCVPPEELAKRDPRFETEHRESVADALAGTILDGGIVERGPQRWGAEDCPNCKSRRAGWDKPPGLPTGERLYRVRIPVSIIVLAKSADDAEECMRRSLSVGSYGEDVEPTIGDTAHVSVVRTAEEAGKDWLESAPLVHDDCDLRDDEMPGDGTVGAILEAYGAPSQPVLPVEEMREPDPNQMALPFAEIPASTGT